MGAQLRWTGEHTAYDDFAERGFTVDRDGSQIPGLLWSPPYAGRPALPLVLLGHGGRGSKRHERVARLAQWFAGEMGVAVAAIDAPFHGDRVAVPLSPAASQARAVAIGIETVVDGMVDDWTATVAALAAEGVADPSRLGYVGVSQGTRFGLPLAARLGADLRVAVLGKFGLTSTEVLHPGLAMADRLTRDAPSVSAPVHFHIQWDDEVFPRAGQLALFDLIGSADKVLQAYPGLHAETREGAVATWCRFVAERLGTSLTERFKPW
ncbi:MAG: hypothetical protein ABI131_11405 [Nostocoides sp.]